MIWIWKGRVSIAWHCYIYVPSRDDNCRLANRQVFVLMILFGLIRPGIIGQLIERKWPTAFWHWRAQPFPFCNGNRIGVPSLEIAREGNCPLIIERGTVSNHIVKIRCLNAPWCHNASIDECGSWCGSISWLEEIWEEEVDIYIYVLLILNCGTL